MTSRRTPESAARGQGLMLIQRHIVPAVRRVQRASRLSETADIDAELEGILTGAEEHIFEAEKDQALPPEVQAKLLPNEQYAKVQPIKDAAAWETTSKVLPQLWQEHVIIEMQ